MNIVRRIPLLNRIPAFSVGKLGAAVAAARAGIAAARTAAGAVARFDRRFDKVDRELTHIKLLLAANLTLTALLLIKAFLP